MKYFTRELYSAFQRPPDDVLDADLDLEWDRAHRRYAARLRRIKHALPPAARYVASLRLHDSRVASLARQASDVTLVLEQSEPDNLRIDLRFVLGRIVRAIGTPSGDDLLYEEWDKPRDSEHSIEFRALLERSELCIRALDVEVCIAPLRRR